MIESVAQIAIHLSMKMTCISCGGLSLHFDAALAPVESHAVVTRQMPPQISVSSVSERDVDLLLLEEFVASIGFGRWFVGEVFSSVPPIETCLTARRSVTQSNGESDLEILFQVNDGSRLLVMIENKVGARFQPLQAERYCVRAANYLLRGDCEKAWTIITAPEAYFGSSDSCKGFDGRISYESILNWFTQSDSIGARKAYKQAVLQAAIGKSALGYQPVEDAVATKFWRDYWSILLDTAPELRMSEPGFKTAGSTFIGFKPAMLPASVNIVHKLTGTEGARTGFVDLHFQGMSEMAPELEKNLQGLLEPGMTIVRATKSAAVRIIVPTVDPNKDAESQLNGIREGLAAAQRLLQWFKSTPEVAYAINQTALQSDS